MPFLSSLSNPAVQALGWTLLHSCWQAFIVFICLRLMLLLSRNTPAKVRYNLSVGAMLTIFAWFVFTFFHQLKIQEQLRETGSLVVAALSTGDLIPVQYALHQDQGLQQVFPYMENYFPLIVGLYLAGVLLCCLRIIRDYNGLQHIRTRGLVSFDPAWEHYIDKLVKQLSIPRKVKLFVSAIVDVPLMAGFLKPMIFLPVAAINNLTPDQLEAILLHELAHIKRNDYLENIFQTIIETILFFNPFVWWISKNIRKERENCCDDHVISITNPVEYANALVTLEEFRLYANPLTMAAANNKKQLFHRIKRIMEMRTNNLNLTQKLLALLIVAGTIVSIAWLVPEHKDIPKDTPAAGKLIISIPELKNPQFIRANTHLSTPAPVPVNRTTIASGVSHTAVKPVFQQDTLPHGFKRVIVIDSSGNRKEYSSGDEMDSAFRNIDWAKQREDIRKAMEDAKRSIANIDWKKQQAEIEKSMTQVRKSMSQVDWEKQKKEIAMAMEQAKMTMDSSFKNMDWNKINENIKLSMRSADSAMKNMNWDKIKLDMKENMMKARADMEKARAEWQNNTTIVSSGRAIQTNSLVNQMKEDQLIKDENNYNVVLNNKGLYINGRKQPRDAYEKYKKMVGDNTTLKLEKHNGKLHTTINTESSADNNN